MNSRFGDNNVDNICGHCLITQRVFRIYRKCAQKTHVTVIKIQFNTLLEILWIMCVCSNLHPLKHNHLLADGFRRYFITRQQASELLVCIQSQLQVLLEQNCEIRLLAAPDLSVCPSVHMKHSDSLRTDFHKTPDLEYLIKFVQVFSFWKYRSNTYTVYYLGV